MARSLSIATGDTNTETFVPQTTFLVYAAGIPGSTTFTVQMRPRGISTATWVSAQSSGTLTDTSTSAVVNGSPGFEFRIARTTGTTTVARTFYWDHVTSLRSVYN